MNEHYLEEIGLTKGETQVYLSLLNLGQTTSGPLIAESKISSSKVYEIIEKLMRKGLVSSITKNKTRYFQATSPAKIKEYIATKEQKILMQKKELETHLPKLLELYRAQKIQQNAELFIGVPAIKAMLWDIIEDSENENPYLFFGGSGKEYKKAIEKLYHKYAIYRYEKGLRVRGIAHESLRKLLNNKNRYTYTIRYTSFPTPSNISIFKDRIAIISWIEPPISVLITSKAIADQFSEFFENIWKIAKP